MQFNISPFNAEQGCLPPCPRYAIFTQLPEW